MPRSVRAYHNIDDEMVWAIADADVPVWAREIDGALDMLPEERSRLPLTAVSQLRPGQRRPQLVAIHGDELLFPRP